MKTIILMFLSAATLATATEFDPAWRSVSVSSDGEFSWVREVPKSVIADAPQWNPKEGDIPLLPSGAYEKALLAFEKLGIGNASFISMQLNVDTGLPTAYIFNFSNENHRRVSILVFLDGTVISPRIEKNEG